MKRRRRRDNTKNVKNFDTPNSTFTSVETLKPRCFFKLMLSPSSESQTLRIPEKFVRAYREELSASANVVLAVPTGETWNVTLVEDDNKLWFREGWSDFVNKYSIDYGYFVLFRYEGNLRFNVHVFDLTACEITYCFDQELSRDHLGPQQTDNDDNDDDDHDEDDEEEEEEEDDDDNDDDDDDDDSDFECFRSPLRKRIRKVRKRIRKDYSDARVVKSEGEEDDDDQDNATEDESSDHSNGARITKRSLSRMKRETELINAMTAAGFPKPKAPYFAVQIKAYNLGNSFYLNVPSPFARKHLRCNDDWERLIDFETDDGRHWTVKSFKTGPKHMFGKGWIAFAREFGLEIGDICVFEVIPSKHDALKVHIAKKSQLKSTGFVF